MKSGRFSESGLLLFNLETDVEHPILGFTTQWIRALAERVRSIDVITMRAGMIDVPPNVRVHSVGKEHGYSEPRRVLEFYRHLFRILRTQRIDGCFSHMMPPFSVLGGPILRARRIPLVTWYAHPNLTLWVRLAHFFSNRMVTSLPHAYPYRKGKLSVIGQGIDTALFAPSPSAVGSDDLILCAGRISRVKNHPTLLRAAAFLRIPFRLVILGATVGADDEIYARELKHLASELGLEDAVTFASPVPRGELPEHYRSCAVHVNLTPSGFGDKVAWEAMSCGRPCLVANDDFRETLGQHASELLFRNGDATDLAAKLTAILTKTPAERDEIGLYLRAQVERLHSLPRLVGRILDLLADNSVLGSRPTMATESPAPHQPACHQPRRRIGSDGEKSHLRNQTRLSVLYLFTRSRGALLDRVLRGEDHGNNFWGMLQLPRHGVAASYTELEKCLPKTIANFLRARVLSPHFFHAPLFFELFSYDLVFTSTGFGTQLVHTLLPLRKPRWVMHDFSISSLLGEERTLKQRMFAWMVSRSDGIVTLSRPEQELLSNRFPHLRKRIAFIPFGVDLSYFKPFPAEEVREIFVPGTDPYRDYLTLFEAATGLGVPVVVTTKPDRLARLASIPSFVERKWFAPADLLLEYSRAQVVVIPLNTKSGLNDAMGLTVLQESLAMGKAIIATRTVTTESFITDGMNGLLVEEGKVEALRSALDRLLTDTALRSRLGHAARQFAEEHLDSDRQTARLASFFIGLVESRYEPSCCELAATADSVEGTTIRSGRIEVPRES